VFEGVATGMGGWTGMGGRGNQAGLGRDGSIPRASSVSETQSAALEAWLKFRGDEVLRTGYGPDLAVSLGFRV